MPCSLLHVVVLFEDIAGMGYNGIDHFPEKMLNLTRPMSCDWVGSKESTHDLSFVLFCSVSIFNEQSFWMAKYPFKLHNYDSVKWQPCVIPHNSTIISRLGMRGTLVYRTTWGNKGIWRIFSSSSGARVAWSSRAGTAIPGTLVRLLVDAIHFSWLVLTGYLHK